MTAKSKSKWLKFSTLYLIIGGVLLIGGLIKDLDLTQIIGLSTFYYGLSLNRIEKIEDKMIE